jgi:hypothetical protein
MDGHGIQGHLVSGYVKTQLPLIMAKMLSGTTLEDMKGGANKSLANGFLP